MELQCHSNSVNLKCFVTTGIKKVGEKTPLHFENPVILWALKAVHTAIDLSATFVFMQMSLIAGAVWTVHLNPVYIYLL